MFDIKKKLLYTIKENIFINSSKYIYCRDEKKAKNT